MWLIAHTDGSKEHIEYMNAPQTSDVTNSTYRWVQRAYWVYECATSDVTNSTYRWVQRAYWVHECATSDVTINSTYRWVQRAYWVYECATSDVTTSTYRWVQRAYWVYECATSDVTNNTYRWVQRAYWVYECVTHNRAAGNETGGWGPPLDDEPGNPFQLRMGLIHQPWEPTQTKQINNVLLEHFSIRESVCDLSPFAPSRRSKP